MIEVQEGGAELAAQEGPEGGAMTILAPLDRRGLAAIAAAKLAFHLATAGMYGFHRDEFYYLAAGSHPAAGYVDQPPLTPLVYRSWSSIFGASQFSLHSMAAILSIPMVVLGALLARELGGARWAQRATMTVVAVGTVFTTTFHFVSTATIDLLMWGLSTWLLLRLLRRQDPRVWVPIGAVVGLGFENKHTMVLWVVAVTAAMVASDRRYLLWNRWTLVGLAVAAVLAAPNIYWQATHDWASLSFYPALRRRTGAQNLAAYWPLQLGLMTPVGTVLVVSGLLWLRREARAHIFRPLLIVFVFVVAAFFVASGKEYYPAGIYLPVAAAGAVALEGLWSARSRRRLMAGVVITGLLLAPVFTPILPASAAVSLGIAKDNSDLGGMMGWRSVVEQMAGVYRHLPGAERAGAVFLTRDYSEAGAETYWRRAYHLPAAISGHNNYWWWGWAPAKHATTVIAVGLSYDELRPYFSSVTQAASLHAANGQIDPEQAGLPIWVCTGQRVPWPLLWPKLRVYA